MTTIAKSLIGSPFLKMRKTRLSIKELMFNDIFKNNTKGESFKTLANLEHK